MSLCKFYPLFYMKRKSLPRRLQHNKAHKVRKGAPLCICRKGSLTLEAAVILPLTAAFLTFFLFFFRVMQVERAVQEALVCAGREAAAYGSDSSDTGILALGAGLFYKEAGESGIIRQYVKNGSAGILLAESSVDGDYLDLHASYRVSFPIGFFSVNGIDLTAESKSRIWNGRIAEGSGDSDPIVYYTASGSVYHLTKNCSYLDLSIHPAVREELPDLRNKSGGKYYACTLCEAADSKSRMVYITDYGTEYHISLQCSALKRTIYEVRLSQVGNRKACSKCGGE